MLRNALSTADSSSSATLAASLTSLDICLGDNPGLTLCPFLCPVAAWMGLDKARQKARSY